MKNNPKMIAGMIGIAVLFGALIFMTIQIVPMAGEVREEMSLTPTPLPPAPDSVMADPSPDLKQPDWGLAVEDLQERLRALGYFHDSVDGQFGPLTENAVKAFQENNGLPVSGVVDDQTREALYSEKAISYQK